MQYKSKKCFQCVVIVYNNLFIKLLSVIKQFTRWFLVRNIQNNLETVWFGKLMATILVSLQLRTNLALQTNFAGNSIKELLDVYDASLHVIRSTIALFLYSAALLT